MRRPLAETLFQFSHRTVRIEDGPSRQRDAFARVPPERRGSFCFGTLVHLGPAAAFVAFVSLVDFAVGLMVGFALAVLLVNLIPLLWAERRVPSVGLEPPSWSEIVSGMSLVFLKGVGLGTAVVLGGRWLLGQVVSAPWQTRSWAVIFLAVALTDLAYYWTHRALNHGRGSRPLIRWYRRNHSVHHSVTALDFFRGNISSTFDTAVTGFQIPLAILSVILGMDLASTIAAYAVVLLLQATHHVNHTFNIGVLRYVFVDNHAHKLHHCPKGNLVNLAALFSVWDRLFGTFYEDWSLCPNYLEKHRIGLPIQPARRAA